MPANKLTDLLPIPPGTTAPHAYDVFGLEPGLQDEAKIAEAVRNTIAKLKAVKAETDPTLWRQAAQLVQNARVTLADPVKKSQLDARFGIVPDQPAAGPSDDPLAGILPKTDPLSAILPATNPLAPVPARDDANAAASQPAPSQPTGPAAATPSAAMSSPMPPGMFGTPAASPVEMPTTAQQPTPAAPTTAASAPIVAVDDPGPRRKVTRRRKSILGTLFFGVFTLGLLGIIGALVFFLMYGPGQVAITSNDGQFTISTAPTDNHPPQVVAPPRATEPPAPRRSFDPVMGTLAGDVPPPEENTRPSLTDPMDSSESMSADAMLAESMQPDAMPPQAMQPDAMAPEPMAPEPMQPEATSPSPTPPASPMPTEQQIAEAEAALDKVRQAIRSAQWDQMKPLAEAVLEMPMTEAQQQQAEALHELADLASYYRGGIERAVADLPAGNDFAVTDDFRVVVVETGDDLLVVRYNAKNRSFTFDEFPFSLAHRLATFTMPEGPATEAAKAAYQAVAPKALPEHRQQAIDWLQVIESPGDEVDPQRLAATIDALFGSDP